MAIPCTAADYGQYIGGCDMIPLGVVAHVVGMYVHSLLITHANVPDA